MSLIARHLEAAGIPTLCIGSALDILEAGRPPRAVFVDYPLGHTVGKPFDVEDQYAIVSAAIDQFAAIDKPGDIVALANRWSDDDGWRAAAMDRSAGDSRQPRDETPQYQHADDRLAAARAAATD